MSDAYREIMIERKTPVVNKLLKGVMIGFTGLCVFVGMMFWPVLLVSVALGVVSFIVVPKLEVEYEYLYVNGELDIDAIYSKQKRKKIGSYDMAELEILAPAASHALDSYRSQSGLKLKDYTSLNPQVKSYILVFNRDKGQEMIQVELDDFIVNDIRRTAPRKVNLNG